MESVVLMAMVDNETIRELRNSNTELQVSNARIEEMIKGLILKNDTDHDYIKKTLVTQGSELINIRGNVFECQKKDAEQCLINQTVEENSKDISKLKTDDIKRKVLYKIIAPIGSALGGAGIAELFNYLSIHGTTIGFLIYYLIT